MLSTWNFFYPNRLKVKGPPVWRECKAASIIPEQSLNQCVTRGKGTNTGGSYDSNRPLTYMKQNDRTRGETDSSTTEVTSTPSHQRVEQFLVEFLGSSGMCRALPVTVASKLLSGVDVTFPRQTHVRPQKETSTDITYTLQPLWDQVRH